MTKTNKQLKAKGEAELRDGKSDHEFFEVVKEMADS